MTDGIDPFVEIRDVHGATAKVFYHDDGNHQIIYSDNHCRQFYTESFDKQPIEEVVNNAHDWATGKRKLEQCSM